MGVVKRCGEFILEMTNSIMSFINGSSVKNPIETGSLANTVIRKSTGLFKPVNMFPLSLLSVSLTQALNSLRSRKKSDHNAVKFSYELNFRHSQFISSLFTIHSQGLLHFMPHGIHFNYDSQNSFLSNHDSQSTKKPITASRKYPCSPHYNLTQECWDDQGDIFILMSGWGSSPSRHTSLSSWTVISG